MGDPRTLRCIIRCAVRQVYEGAFGRERQGRGPASERKTVAAAVSLDELSLLLYCCIFRLNVQKFFIQRFRVSPRPLLVLRKISARQSKASKHVRTLQIQRPYQMALLEEYEVNDRLDQSPLELAFCSHTRLGVAGVVNAAHRVEGRSIVDFRGMDILNQWVDLNSLARIVAYVSSSRMCPHRRTAALSPIVTDEEHMPAARCVVLVQICFFGELVYAEIGDRGILVLMFACSILNKVAQTVLLP